MKKSVFLPMACVCLACVVAACTPVAPAGGASPTPLATAIASQTPAQTAKPQETPPPPPAEIEDWRATYEAVVEDHTKSKSAYAEEFAVEMAPFVGITLFIADLDLDGAPELFIGYVGEGQMDFLLGYYVYRAGGVGDTPELVCGQRAENPMSALAMVNDRHNLYAVKHGDASYVGVYHLRNEGTYDYALTFDKIILTQSALQTEHITAINTPDDVVEEYWNGEGDVCTDYLLGAWQEHINQSGMEAEGLPALVSGLVGGDDEDVVWQKIN